MTPRERADALLLTLGTLLLIVGLQWITRVILLRFATVETYWWLELVGLGAGAAWAILALFLAAPFGKVAMGWLLVTAGLIWGIGPLVTSPEQAKWLLLVPR
ncbi:MAG: hypothetical protein H9533_11475, partial [Rhodobacteraceae bacterium]|nr:hypothetical protein [Paracoccaceae bacterium]